MLTVIHGFLPPWEKTIRCYGFFYRGQFQSSIGNLPVEEAESEFAPPRLLWFIEPVFSESRKEGADLREKQWEKGDLL